MRYLSLCSGIEAASCAWHPLGVRGMTARRVCAAEAAERSE